MIENMKERLEFRNRFSEGKYKHPKSDKVYTVKYLGDYLRKITGRKVWSYYDKFHVKVIDGEGIHEMEDTDRFRAEFPMLVRERSHASCGRQRVVSVELEDIVNYKDFRGSKVAENVGIL